MTAESVALALLELQKLVIGSRVDCGDNSDVPYLTVDGKRQVCAMGNYPGYDLWVPKRKPGMCKMLIDDMTCNDFGVSVQQAVAFLEGAPMNVVRNMVKSNQSEPQKESKRVWRMMGKFKKHLMLANGNGGAK